MGKIYYGERGSGKTTRLLKQAAALAEDGLIPVLICVRNAFIDTLKMRAATLNINTEDFVFLTFEEAKDPKNYLYFSSPRYRVMIDELTCFIRDILEIKAMSGFYATLSSEDCIEVSREDWSEERQLKECRQVRLIDTQKYSRKAIQKKLQETINSSYFVLDNSSAENNSAAFVETFVISKALKQGETKCSKYTQVVKDITKVAHRYAYSTIYISPSLAPIFKLANNFRAVETVALCGSYVAGHVRDGILEYTIIVSPELSKEAGGDIFKIGGLDKTYPLGVVV